MPPDWELDASGALRNFQRYYLRGDTQRAEQQLAAAKAEIRRTGRADLLARAELIRCAVRAASLEFDDCPGFEVLRADAGPEEVSYWNYLTGRAERAASDEPISRLVWYGVRFRNGRITPPEIVAATETSSAQGWRRPLLAWLGVQAKRAEEAGDRDAASRLRRRIDLITATEVRPR